MENPTVIKVDKSTRELLRSLGAKGESYDSVIKRLIAHWTVDPPKGVLPTLEAD